jgi:hypothetical protein
MSLIISSAVFFALIAIIWQRIYSTAEIWWAGCIQPVQIKSLCIWLGWSKTDQAGCWFWQADSTTCSRCSQSLFTDCEDELPFVKSIQPVECNAQRCQLSRAAAFVTYSKTLLHAPCSIMLLIGVGSKLDGESFRVLIWFKQFQVKNSCEYLSITCSM